MLLRPYQTKMIEGARSEFKAGHSRVIMQAPTGAGKTVLAAYMLKSAAERGSRVMFIVHRDYLMTQSSEAFRKVGLSHGLIAPQYRPHDSQTQIASIMTLARRAAKLPAPDLIVIDEAHRTMGATYLRLLEMWPKARVVGLTATPERLDRKPLGEVYQAIVDGPEMRWLITNGFLSDYRVYVPPSSIDLSGLKQKFGDYEQTELSKRVDKPTVTGSAIEHYNRLLSGKRAVVFCTGIAHSLHVAESFNDAGIKAEHVDGETPFAERRAIISRFESGETKILCNVDLVSEGFDLPAVEGVIMLRPTKSLVKYIQSVGRCLRPSAGKQFAIILDHVGNVSEHGMPDEVREWSLEAKPRNAKVAKRSTKNCPQCYAVHLPAPVCPQCQFVYPVRAARSGIESVDGTLIEVSASDIKTIRANRTNNARTIEELEAVGREFGYKPNWARIIWAARQQKKARY